MKVTPVLVVDAIEPSLPFWVDRMGFEKAIEMPAGDRLGFVILTRDGAEVMLQTSQSVREDEPKFAPDYGMRTSALFIEVDDFADTLRRLEGYPVAMAERTAFYGMREIGVFDPGGNMVTFAALATADDVTAG
jgi:hypothetical protein